MGRRAGVPGSPRREPVLDQVVAAPGAKAFKWTEARSAVRALRRRRYDVALEFQGCGNRRGGRGSPGRVV